MDDAAPRKLKIDLTEMAFAFENSSWETDYFLDLETGQVVIVLESSFRDLENILDDFEEIDEDDAVDLDDVLNNLDLEDWERSVILQAEKVKAGLEERYLSIPLADSHEAFQDMKVFIETIKNKNIHTQFTHSISGRHPFRRFKDALLDNPQEREDWFSFKKDRIMKRAQDWLAANGIKPL